MRFIHIRLDIFACICNVCIRFKKVLKMRNIVYLLIGLVVWAVNLQASIYDDMRQNLQNTLQTPGKTVVSLAEDLGVKASTLHSFLSGKSRTSPKVKQAYDTWRATLNVQVDDPEMEELTGAVRKLTFDDVEEEVAEETGLELAPICIPVRGESDDKDAKGTFYDHFVIQSATGHLTKAVSISELNQACEALISYTRDDVSFVLPYGLGSRKLPVFTNNIENEGLLVIAGRMRAKEFDDVRAKTEMRLIREALRRGQPILGICAGAWRVWHVLRQLELDPNFSTPVPEGTVDVVDHGAPRMMSLSMQTQTVGYNIQMHGVEVLPGTLLFSLMNKPQGPLAVNSVHWKAVDAAMSPESVKISARSVAIDLPERRHRCGSVIHPETNTIEAFETQFGSIVMGVQWHLEAYDPKNDESVPHMNILRWMALAGDAYAQKRRVLKQLKQSYETR